MPPATVKGSPPWEALAREQLCSKGKMQAQAPKAWVLVPV